MVLTQFVSLRHLRLTAFDTFRASRPQNNHQRNTTMLKDAWMVSEVTHSLLLALSKTAAWVLFQMPWADLFFWRSPYLRLGEQWNSAVHQYSFRRKCLKIPGEVNSWGFKNQMTRTGIWIFFDKKNSLIWDWVEIRSVTHNFTTENHFQCSCLCAMSSQHSSSLCCTLSKSQGEHSILMLTDTSAFCTDLSSRSTGGNRAYFYNS